GTSSVNDNDGEEVTHTLENQTSLKRIQPVRSTHVVQRHGINSTIAPLTAETPGIRRDTDSTQNGFVVQEFGHNGGLRIVIVDPKLWGHIPLSLRVTKTDGNQANQRVQKLIQVLEEVIAPNSLAESEDTRLHVTSYASHDIETLLSRKAILCIGDATWSRVALGELE
ncbi:MAG: hypothetical protein AAFP90_20510, partial [Planctomycetota bacterium]